LEFHTSPVGGHSGFLKTYHRVKKEFFWDGLKNDVQRFIAEFLVFQQNKVETIKTPGLLQPLSIPSQHWEEVSMDFITGLSKSKGKSFIMVIVDRLDQVPTLLCTLPSLQSQYNCHRIHRDNSKTTWNPKDYCK
jgi:hypothetical protein